MTDEKIRELRAHARQMDDVLSEGVAKLRAIRVALEARGGTGETEVARVPAGGVPLPAKVFVPSGILYGVGAIWSCTHADAQECVFMVRNLDGRRIVVMPLAALSREGGLHTLASPYRRGEGEILVAEVWPAQGHVEGSVSFVFELERL